MQIFQQVIRINPCHPMSVSEFILSVDIGTGTTKAVLFDTDAKQVAIARQHHPIHAPNRDWSEQEPEVILNAVLEAIRAIVKSLPRDSRILGVSFSSQLYSVLAVGPNGKPLTNSLIWSDIRSAEIAQSISLRPEAPGICQRTGCPIDALYPLAKILWLKENFELPASARFISIKEYVIFRLIGQWVLDWSVASATGLFDIKRYDWDETALSLLDITPANLSELVPPRYIFTKWNKEIVELVGLPPDTPLIIGGGDGPLASIGVGAYSSHTLAVNVGTSAAARLIISEAEVDPEGRLWTYVVDEGLWVIGGMVSSGGIVYDWFLKNLLSGREEIEDDDFMRQVHEYADRIASAIPPGAENLIFIPYLSGEQCPAWYPHTRGSFVGLDFRHGKGHFVRAVLEGITRSIYRVYESIQSALNMQLNEIRVTGGLTSSPLWLQIAADMFGSPVVVPESAEGSARGAAILAVMALGLKSNIEDFVDPLVAHERVQPREEVHTYYQKQYQTFRKLLDCTRGLQQDQEV
jgi:gluconokinase